MLEILKQIKNYKKEFTISQILAVTATLTAVPTPLLMPILIDEVILKKGGWWVNTINHIFGHLSAIGYILFTLFVVVFLRSIVAVLDILQTYFFEKITKDIAYKYRIKIISHLKHLSMNEYENLKTGDIASRLVSDIKTVEEFLIKTLSKSVVSFFTLVAVSVILLSINLKLGLFILFLNPFVIIFSTKLAKKVKHIKKEENRSISIFQEALIETLELFEQIKAYNKETPFFKRLISLAEDLKHKSYDFSFKSEAFSRLSFLIFLIGFETFRAAGLVVVSMHELSIGLMIAVFSYLWMMMGPIQELISIQYNYFAAKAAVKRIEELMKLKKEPAFAHRANPFENPVKIDAVNLSFKYHADEWILKNANVAISPYKITALVGASGGGKTTFAKIIAGFFVPDEGDILYNGISYKNIGLDVIRKNVALILQETRLFNDTLRFNLTLGENFDDKEIYEALKMAELYESVQKMPQKLDTYVGKNGVKLSGGQKQRVAIARALLHKPKVIILDESTSALDIDTEDRVFKNIENFLKERTSVIIAHRAETIAKANEIIMIKNKSLIKISATD